MLPAVSLSPSRMVVGFTCTLYPGLWPGQCSRPGQSCILAPWMWHSQKPRCLAAEHGWGSVCRAVRPGSQSPAFSQIPTKPRKEHRNATQEVPSSQPPSLGLRGGVEIGLWVTTPSSLSTPTRDFTSSTAAVCVWLSTQAALTQLPETSLQGTTVTQTFQS